MGMHVITFPEAEGTMGSTVLRASPVLDLTSLHRKLHLLPTTPTRPHNSPMTMAASPGSVTIYASNKMSEDVAVVLFSLSSRKVCLEIKLGRQRLPNLARPLNTPRPTAVIQLTDQLGFSIDRLPMKMEQSKLENRQVGNSVEWRLGRTETYECDCLDEAFMLQRVQMSEDTQFMIWWYIAVVPKDVHERWDPGHGTGKFVGFDEALSNLEEKGEVMILQKAIEILHKTFGKDLDKGRRDAAQPDSAAGQEEKEVSRSSVSFLRRLLVAPWVRVRMHGTAQGRGSRS